ncbi:MAG TPA: 1-(5-phosphoribosyl)-5-[(5-phosphoribosylamino)methylideneamino]imidazole-4-carboxamide isomerase [Pyrinomonadaceae bacterium]|nr:1-(5-phosphoribosyl)-5-[(5-phosphoribosylamino)methylideneamino]imidazole-4-carboxamide isomerase [Pyrinomonadaceae bacterium]
MLIIPAIDLRIGRCVRLKQGRKDTETHYHDDPVELAKTFQRQGANWLHVVDLDGAFKEPNSQNRQTLKKILGAVSLSIQFGGGVRSFYDVEQLLALGVARVVIGTLAVEEPNTLHQLVTAFNPDRVAVGIDVKNGQVLIRGWEQTKGTDALSLARGVARAGVKRIIYTDVLRDGTLEGPNIEATRTIARESGLRVTASGGIASLDDLRRLKALADWGVDAAIVGRAIYEKRFTLEEAIQAAT